MSAAEFKECDYCVHDFDEHSLVATTGDPLEGGIILCPEPLCICYSTWSIEGKGKETVLQPPEDDVALIRANLQGFFEAHDIM